MILGLTGGYCSGKNSVAALLAAGGWTCIDADKLGHEAMDMARDAIVERFGAAVLDSKGGLDRRALARLVFADTEALADQEAIVHPVAIRLMEEGIAAAESAARAAGEEPRVCINAALLHRTERIASCDAVIEVRAPLLRRLVRGARRDGAGLGAALRRITRQRGFRAALRAAAGAAGRPVIVLRNGGSPESLRASTLRALGQAREAAERRPLPASGGPADRAGQ